MASVNDGPAAIHDFLDASEDTAASVDVTLNDLDDDGDALTVIDVHVPDHGTATFNGIYRTCPNLWAGCPIDSRPFKHGRQFEGSSIRSSRGSRPSK